MCLASIEEVKQIKDGLPLKALKGRNSIAQRIALGK
jgi:hypothetical protein